MEVCTNFFIPLPAITYTIYHPHRLWWCLRGEHTRRPQSPSFLRSCGMGSLPCFPCKVILTSNKRLYLNVNLKLSNIALIPSLLSHLTMELNGTWKPDVGTLFLITALCWDGQGCWLTCASNTLTDVWVCLRLPGMHLPYHGRAAFMRRRGLPLPLPHTLSLNELCFPEERMLGGSRGRWSPAVFAGARPSRKLRPVRND